MPASYDQNAIMQSNTGTLTPHTLGAFWACPHGEAIAYRATLETQGAEAVQMILKAISRELRINSSKRVE